MDLGRMLLETDTPLLLPPKYYGMTNNSKPYMVVDIASEIGHIRHIPTEAVLAVTHHNTHWFFNLVGNKIDWSQPQGTHTPLEPCVYSCK